jgi:hypothetical protein
VLALAIAYLAFACAVAMTWHFPQLEPLIPQWLSDWMYPIDKTNLDVLRFAHFLALAAITVRFVPRTWPALQSRWLWPAIVCGRHSLEVFCLGVFLSFAGHFAMVELGGGLAMQVIVSVLGILTMIAAAGLISWYKRSESRSTARPKKPGPDLAGGEA